MLFIFLHLCPSVLIRKILLPWLSIPQLLAFKRKNFKVIFSAILDEKLKQPTIPHWESPVRWWVAPSPGWPGHWSCAGTRRPPSLSSSWSQAIFQGSHFSVLQADLSSPEMFGIHTSCCTEPDSTYFWLPKNADPQSAALYRGKWNFSQIYNSR